MSVTCRRQDMNVFEDLGFRLEFETSPESLVIEMVDDEANYAHADEMPTNIPYHGTNGSGDNYASGNLGCDGKQYAEVETGHGSGFMVSWDYQKSRPTPQSLKKIRHFIRIHERAQKILKRLRRKEPHQHLFSPDTHTCVKCGIHADDDAVENNPCIK